METELVANIQAALDRYTASLEAMQLRRAAAELKELWTIGNVYLDRAAPWTAIKTDKDRAAVDPARRRSTWSGSTRSSARRSSPTPAPGCAPASASRSATDYWPNDAAAELQALPAGHRFEVPPPLFKKIAPEEVADLSERYGGEEAAEAAA